MSSSPSCRVKRRCPEALLEVLREHADPTAQAVRRALLRGARVLVVRAGYAGETVRRDYYHRAAKLGVRLTLLHEQSDTIHGLDELVTARLVENVLSFDLNHESARSLLLEKLRAEQPFDGVVTFFEFGLPLAAWLAEQLELVGNDPQVVAIGRDKELMRQASLRAGVSAPRFSRIQKEADLLSAAEKVGFPAVLKPVSGLTAIEVHRVNDFQDLVYHYRTTQERMRTEAHANPSLLRAVLSGSPDMILEEFLDGPEFDVDLLLCEGELVYGSVTDNQTHPEWPCVQIGANMPSTLRLLNNEDWLIGTAAKWARQLGYSDGAFHIEGKLRRSDGSPVLLEINARIGGASQYELNHEVWGVDLIEEILLGCVGIPIRPCKSIQPRRWYAARYLLAPQAGTIRSSTFLDSLAFPSDVHVLARNSWVQSGEPVDGPVPGPPSWLGELTVGAANLATAQQVVEEVLSKVVVPIEPSS